MAKIITGDNALDAWRAAATNLLGANGVSDNNLLIEIADPVAWDETWIHQIDPRAVHSDGEDPMNVANTIFPHKTWSNSVSREDFYRRYSRAHAKGRNKRWGTYFLRLIDFGRSHVNQLERAIVVMNTWENEPGTSIVFHLSSPEIDRPRPLGGPCLQLCQLNVHDRRVDMTVVYRNHDYFNKAFPNFVGLGRLLKFICNETNRQPGSLVCHSGHAYSSNGKHNLQRLLERA